MQIMEHMELLKSRFKTGERLIWCSDVQMFHSVELFHDTEKIPVHKHRVKNEVS